MTIFWILLALMLKETFTFIVLLLLARRQGRNLQASLPEVIPKNHDELMLYMSESCLHTGAIYAGLFTAFTWAMLGLVLCYGMKTGIIWH